MMIHNIIMYNIHIVHNTALLISILDKILLPEHNVSLP